MKTTKSFGYGEARNRILLRGKQKHQALNLNQTMLVEEKNHYHIISLIQRRNRKNPSFSKLSHNSSLKGQKNLSIRF